MKVYAPVAMACMLLAATLDSQSLRETAKRGVNPHRHMTTWLPVADVPDVFSRSELVIHGSILSVKTHFTSDDSMIVTDYTLSPLRIVKQSKAANTSVSPGQTRPLTLRCLGGTIVEGETRYSVTVDVFPSSEAFRVGEQVVLFLVYDEKEAVYLLTHGPFAAFRVIGGQVHPMTKQVAKDRGDRPRPLEEFLSELGR